VREANPSMPAIKVCYVAGREAGYSRTHNILKALKNAGFEVQVCLPPDKSKAHQPRLLWEFLQKARGADVVLVGFYGHLLMPFVRLLSRKPILFDVYVSTHAAMVEDRLEAAPKSLKARLFWLADYIAVHAADHLILETRDHIGRYADACHVEAAKFSRIFLTSDDSTMRPREPRPPDGRFRVHFHGEYAPFHGVNVILRAAKLLENAAVDFQLIGTGLTYERDRQLAASLQLRNVDFIDRVPYDELAVYMSKADACLGIFGGNKRAERELTNKVVEGMAVGKPIITRRNAPVQELLRDGESVVLVPPDDARALADAILRLQADPAFCQRLGDAALAAFREQCTQAAFAEQLKQVVQALVKAESRAEASTTGPHRSRT
jgi:glycosyltransferase involved in cell wall biosynthesis